MYAIIDSGGKQYRVEEGSLVTLERLPGDVGDKVTFDRVLLVSGDETTVGAPTVDGVAVQGTIEEQGRADKIIVFKFKRRKMYRRRRGHRQEQTVVRIDSIGGAAPAKKAVKKSAAAKDSPKSKAAPKKEAGSNAKEAEAEESRE